MQFRFQIADLGMYQIAMPDLLSAAQWLERAEEARLVAESLSDGSARRTMLTIAAGYEKMARHAALQAGLNIPHEPVEHY